MAGNRLLSDLSRILQTLYRLTFLFRVGLNRDHDEHRIDLLAGCDNGSIDFYASGIETLLKNHWQIVDCSVSDDSVRFHLPGDVSGGIAVCNATAIVQQIKGWISGRNLEGQHRSWAVGYWIPEALCGDLATAEPLYDARGVCAEIRKLVVPYPSSLAESIICLTTDEIWQKLTILEGLLDKGNSIELGLCLSDISIAMVRLAFARSHCYLRGFGHLAEQTLFLSPSNLPLYELAFNLSKKGGVRDLVAKIRRTL